MTPQGAPPDDKHTGAAGPGRAGAPRPPRTPQGAPPDDKNPGAAGPGREALGRSRGGLTTKIHLAADRRCRPVARLTSPGQHGDSPRFIPVMDAIRIPRRGKGRPRAPPGGRPPVFDPGHYKQRNTVERCFSKLKQFRAVATRYDKRERIYQGTIDIASIRIWLRDPVT